MKGGVVDEGGGMESEERRVDRDDIEVETEDSRDRVCLTWISSWIERFRLRDVAVVFIDERLAAAALRFDAKEDDEVRF